MKTILATLLILLPVLITAQTITVKQDGTGDFTTIQDAVFASINGDTVLVWPGTYYENITLSTKKITLGSLVLTTNDISYRNTTIIDGSQNGSCIYTTSMHTSVNINGFTLQNGSGYFFPQTGRTKGGGIYISKKNDVIIENCLLQNNISDYGGGVYLEEGVSQRIVNCIIINNIAILNGAGMLLGHNSNVFLSGVSVHHNHSYNGSGGIGAAVYNTLTFDSVNRCNLYLNYAGIGCDFGKNFPKLLDLYVDTLTVFNPDGYFVLAVEPEGDPVYDITCHIQHAVLTPVDSDLYVNPITGSNDNSGLSFNEPVKTIAFANSLIAVDSNQRNTIHLANGFYCDSTNSEKFPINIRPYINYIGESREGTILDGREMVRLFKGNNIVSNYNIEKMTLQRGRTASKMYFQNRGTGLMQLYNQEGNINIDSMLFQNIHNLAFFQNVSIGTNNSITISNSIFNNTSGVALGVGVRDSAFIYNCIFQNNMPDTSYSDTLITGRALVLGSDSNGVKIVLNSLFIRNNCQNIIDVSGWPTDVISSNYIVNCTFTDNGKYHDTPTFWFEGSHNYFYNCILYDEGGPYSFLLSDEEHTHQTFLALYYSLIETGEEAIEALFGTNYYFDTTNIDTDPLFYGGAEFPYNLSDESPCIDAGTLDLPQFVLDHMPDTDLAGNPRIFNGKIDMGAYEWNPTVGISKPIIPNPHPNTQHIQTAPNPFGTQTTISAQWDKPARINIEVYNAAGLLVKTLQQGRQFSGSCQIPWDGTDNSGNYLPSGVYVVVLRIDAKEIESVKVVKK